MAKFLELNDLFRKINHKNVHTWLDSLTFPYILIIWIVVIVTFGFVYYAYQSSSSSLTYSYTHTPVNTIDDSIYFSFVTATTTGFGDIVPSGMFKLIAIIEVVFGWLLLALVTSKLVSIKQDIILNELYEGSINEKVIRLRSSLLLFRQNLDRLLAKIDERIMQKRDINNLYVFLASFEDSLHEIAALISKQGEAQVVKSLDSMHIELIVSSIINSFDKLNETIGDFKKNKIDWKQELTIDLINRCIDLNEQIFLNIALSKKLNKQTSSDINERKDRSIGILNSFLK